MGQEGDSKIKLVFEKQESINSPLTGFSKFVPLSKNKLEPNVKAFAIQCKEYGKRWSQKVKGNPKAMPTPEEILLGLYRWLCS